MVLEENPGESFDRTDRGAKIVGNSVRERLEFPGRLRVLKFKLVGVVELLVQPIARTMRRARIAIGLRIE